MASSTVKPKNKILKFLPKAAQAGAVSFQDFLFSPGRDRIRTHHSKGFSGPIMTSMIPLEARGRSKNFETQEPTSPKVSCMGQVKHRKKISKKKHVSPPKKARPEKPSKPEITGKASPVTVELKKKPSGVWKLFGPGRKSDASIDYNLPPQHQLLAEGTPDLGQMRKFASSRETFANFDWTSSQIAPEENRRDSDDSDQENRCRDREVDVIIPFSAPMVMGGGAGAREEPRKEINLWKRRTMAQPKPLKLNKIKSSLGK